MKFLLQVLLVVVAIVAVFLAVAGTVGLLIRVAVILGVAAIVLALVRNWWNDRTSGKLQSRSHSKAEKAAERRLKEMERDKS